MKDITPQKEIIPLKEKVVSENEGLGAKVGGLGGRLEATLVDAINKDGNLVNDVINARIDTEAKSILKDFSFGSTDFSGAVKSGDITWNISTGAITGGSGVVLFRGGIIGASAGTETFSINATTGAATFAGALSAPTGNIGGFTINSDNIIDTANSFGLASTISGGNDVRFWAGATFANRATAPFRVYENGDVVASSLTLTGYIATGGAAADVNTYGTTISGGKITTGTITADRMSVSQLSAIAADIGTITAGSITGITITGGTIRTAASGKRVEMLGSANTFTSYDSAGTKRMDLDSEVLAFYNSSGTAIGSVYADAATSNLLISTNPTNSSIYISGKGTGVVSLGIGTTNYLYLSGTNANIVSAKNFVSVGTVSIGESSNPWSDIYTYDLWSDKLQDISGANVIDLSLSNRIATNQTFQFKNATADPAGYEGGVYFNTTTNKLRVYAAGAWVDLH